MTPSKIFFYFCLSFIIGVFIASLLFAGQFFLFAAFILAIIIIFISFLLKSKKAAVIGFCLLFFLFGVWRYQVFDLKIKNSGLKNYNDQNVVLAGKILTEPDIKENSVQLTIDVEKIEVGGEEIPISGKLLVKTNKYPEYNYADRIKISGFLKTPEEFQDFNYKEYLAKKGIFSLADWPKIEIISKKDYSNWRQFAYGKILDFKNKIRENINQNFSYPESALLLAMVLGDQSSMPQTLKDNLNITGLRHITAVSGMNVAILSGVLTSLFLGIGLSRNRAFYLTLLFIFLFALMVGFQASIVRAGIMGTLFLLAQKFGRLPAGVRIITITAAAMLILNPMLLRWDVGFQLSFLAMLGIILLTRPFGQLLKFIPQEKLFNFRSIVAVTFAAQIFTLPILIYNFGRVSLVSPITNILILSVIYWVMIFGFLFGIISSIWSLLGWVFILPCWFLISYSMKIIDIFSQPWAMATTKNVHWIWLIILYLITAGFTVWLKRKARLKFLEY